MIMTRSGSAPFLFSAWYSSSSSTFPPGKIAVAGGGGGGNGGGRVKQRHQLSRRGAKLLVGAILLFFLLTVFSLLSFLSTNSSSSVVVSLPSPTPTSRKGYSILLNTWKRNDLLKQSVFHYTSCLGVKSIHVVWSEPDPPPDSLVDTLRQALQSKRITGQEIELKFDLNEENSLNNRFKEIKDLSTDAILSIDDDIILPCATVEFAFSVWQSAPNVMVGFVPRMHWFDKTNGTTGHYRYGGWWSVWWKGTYSMILSKAAFFHKKYLSIYTNEMHSSIRDYITANRNCEDIAMSFLVANVSQAPPIWVKGKIYDMGWSGISSLVGHNEQRTQCLNDFLAIYGHMPLTSTHVKAVDSQNSWFW